MGGSSVRVALSSLLLPMVLSGCIGAGDLTGGLGRAAYELHELEHKDGRKERKVTIFNSKDYERLKVTYTQTLEGKVKIILNESGADSTSPAIVGAKAQAEMAKSNSALAGALGAAIKVIAPVP